MQKIATLEVLRHQGNKKIDLLAGNLVELPPAHAVDVLVVATVPNDYWPTWSSLVGALAAQGIDVAGLALEPEIDLKQDFGCWLSRPLAGAAAERLNVKRILCFAPDRPQRGAEVVGQIFQSLAPFTYAEPHLLSVAMPILDAGDPIGAVSRVMEDLLDASFHWLKQGFPLQTIKLIVNQGEGQVLAHVLFQTESERLWRLNDFSVLGGYRDRDWANYKPLSVDGDKQARWGIPFPRAPASLPQASTEHYIYDVFVSYSRKDEEAARHLHGCLKAAGLRVFIDQDRVAIAVGAAWQQKIFDALGSCNRVAVLYSPDFVKSKVCKEEFNIAWMRARDLDREVIFPLLIDEMTLPPHMKILNYVDCRIRDKPKIKAAAAELAASLK